MIGTGKTTSVVGGFPKPGEAIRGTSESLREGSADRSPGEEFPGDRIHRGSVCEDSPGEESTGVVCEDSPGGKSPGEDLNRCFNNIYNYIGL